MDRQSLKRCCYRQLTPIPLKDNLTLTSWEKWRKYHRFPWKLVSDSVTLVLSIVIVLLVSAQITSYSHACNETFNRLFRGNGTTNVYSSTELQQQLTEWTNNYWNLPTVSLSRFGLFRNNGTGEVVAPLLTLVRYNISNGFWNRTEQNFHVPDGSLTTVQEQFSLSRDDPLGPLTVGNSTALDLALLQSCVRIVLHAEFLSLNTGPLGAIPYRWRVDGVFNIITGGGTAEFTVFAAKSRYREHLATEFSVLVTLSGLLFASAAVSLVLSARALYRGLANYLLMRHMFAQLPPHTIGKYTKFYTDWASLPFSMKARFFSFWNMWNCVGSIMLIVACSISFAEHLDIGSSSPSFDLSFNLTMGIGTFFTCVNWTRYMELSRRFHVLVSTLRLSFGRVFSFILSVTPVFVAFLMLGLSVFSQFSARFATLDQVAVTLFCLANGDEMHATFQDLNDVFPWVWISRIYLYIYAILFIAAIMNIFIFLIEDAFQAAKTWDRKIWKERQQFTLVNLVAILELEGNGLIVNENGTWGLQDPYSNSINDEPRSSSEFRARDFRAHLDSRELGGRLNIGRVTATAKVAFDTEAEPLLPVVNDPQPPSPARSAPVRAAPGTPSAQAASVGDSTPPPPTPLKRSITKAIQHEIKARTRRRNTDGQSGGEGAGTDKEKDEAESDGPGASAPLVGDSEDSVDAIVDAVMKKLQKRMTKELDGMAKALRKQLRKESSVF